MLTFVDDGTAPIEVAVGAEWMAYPLAFGPDDVLYLSLLEPYLGGYSGGGDPVATSGPRAGDTVGRRPTSASTRPAIRPSCRLRSGLVQVGRRGHGDRQPAGRRIRC